MCKFLFMFLFPFLNLSILPILLNLQFLKVSYFLNRSINLTHLIVCIEVSKFSLSFVKFFKLILISKCLMHSENLCIDLILFLLFGHNLLFGFFKVFHTFITFCLCNCFFIVILILIIKILMELKCLLLL